MEAERPLKAQYVDHLEDQVREIAWSWAGKKANGQLQGATYFWPSEVLKNYKSINNTLDEVHRCICDCRGKKKHRPCEHFRERSTELLTKSGVPAKLAERIAQTVADMAHARSDDRSRE